MKINPIILEYLKNNNNTITTSEAIKLGFTRAVLSKYEKNGLLVREHQGVYILVDSLYDEMYTLMQRSNKIIYSHESALFLNNLSDRTPFTHSVTFPSNSCIPKSIELECECYYIKPEYHDLGLTIKKTTFGSEVRCYNAERTICDIIRSRRRINEEDLINAIKNYVNSKDKDLNLLNEYAIKLKVSKLLRRYLEVLL